MTETMRELATGRFYIDGEPEVRIRQQPLPGAGRETLLLVVTTLGDDNGPVGLTSSMFATPAADVEAAVPQAKDNVAGRVASIGGRVLHQEVELLDAVPEDLTRFVVVNLLRSAERLLPH
jgi:hypothetical protein